MVHYVPRVVAIAVFNEHAPICVGFSIVDQSQLRRWASEKIDKILAHARQGEFNVVVP